MQIYDFDKIIKFEEILKKHFLNIEETKIGTKIKPFMKELTASGFDKNNVLKYLVNYLTDIFIFGEDKTSDGSLNVSRDFAMSLFANVFSDNVTDIEHNKFKKEDFMMFLAGILDSPKQSSKLSSYIGKIAQHNENVLITGDTGTGKELHASAIHYLSKRVNKGIVRLNCAAIPKDLMESELFGIVKGIATGVNARDGILNAVEDGTLFLDEIGDMPLQLQAKFLRVLQSRKFYKVGDYKKEHKFNGRVIAATNMNLKTAIVEAPPKFRLDLFYRLNQLPLKLPSFRDFSKQYKRTVIINKLRYITYIMSEKPRSNLRSDFRTRNAGNYFTFNRQLEQLLLKDERFISDEALQLLVDYDFKGNYRELESILRQAYLLSENGRIEVTDLPSEVTEHKEAESSRYRQESIDIERKPLKDIAHYANEVKINIVRQKVESVYHSGRTITSMLKAEGLSDKKNYHRIRKNIVDIIGQAELSRITKGK